MSEQAAAGGVASGGEREAVVRALLPNAMVRVELSDGEQRRGRLLTGHLAGDARARLTRLVPGDRVLVQVSPRDPGLCRIVGRPRDVRAR